MRTSTHVTSPSWGGRKIAQRFFGWGTLLAILTLSSVAAAPTLDPKSGYVMAPDHARDLLNQCSRATPRNIGGVWTPNSTQISELESRLVDAVRHQQPDVRNGYGRQYAGLIIGGKKFIYVNAYPGNVTDGLDRDLRRDPVMVCDGGHDFFGVLYDPATKTFSQFAFNGFA